MSEAMLWNKARNRSVRASKLRQFTIGMDFYTPGSNKWLVTAYFNKDESFDFGMFDTKEEATAFLEALHAQIEGRVA